MIQNPVVEYDVGFKPKQLVVSLIYNNSHNLTCVYDEDYSTTKWRRYYQGSIDEYSFHQNVTGLDEITSTGFKFVSSTFSTVKWVSYLAIG